MKEKFYWTLCCRTLFYIFISSLIYLVRAAEIQKTYNPKSSCVNCNLTYETKSEGPGSKRIQLGEGTIKATHPISNPGQRNQPENIEEENCAYFDNFTSNLDLKNSASVGLLEDNIIVLQRMSFEQELKFICDDGTRMSNMSANYTTAEEFCVLKKVTTVHDNELMKLEIMDPVWIGIENIVTEEAIVWEHLLSKNSDITCSEENRSVLFLNESTLKPTIRIFNRTSNQGIRHCCDRQRSLGPPSIITPIETTTILQPTVTPTGTVQKTLLVLISVTLSAICLFCIICCLCKSCCKPTKRPSYRVEYADPSDVIASSSGTEYSTPYDTRKSAQKVLKISEMSGPKPKRSKLSIRNISLKIGSSKKKLKRSENDSGFSDLMRSNGTSGFVSEEERDPKESQYMEIPYAKIQPKTKTLKNSKQDQQCAVSKDEILKAKYKLEKRDVAVRFSLPFPKKEQENPYEEIIGVNKTSLLDNQADENRQNIDNPYM